MTLVQQAKIQRLRSDERSHQEIMLVLAKALFKHTLSSSDPRWRSMKIASRSKKSTSGSVTSPCTSSRMPACTIRIHVGVEGCCTLFTQQ